MPGSPRAGRRRATLLLLFALAWTSLAPAQGPERTDTRIAAVRLLHLDSARGPVDVWIGGVHAFAAAEPGAPSRYATVPAGAQEVFLAEADAAPEEGAPEAEAVPASSSTLGTIALEDGAYATLLLLPTDVLPEEEGDGATAPLLLLDPPSELPPAGRAAVRLVHADPGEARLALVVRDPDRSTTTPPAFASSDDAASGHLARPAPLAASDYAALEAGRHGLWLVREGGESATAEPLEAVLRAGTLYTLYAIPAEETGVRPVLVVDATAPLAPTGGTP